MPNWSELLEEIKSTGSTFDHIRRKYLRILNEVTERNVVAYYLARAKEVGTPEVNSWIDH